MNKAQIDNETAEKIANAIISRAVQDYIQALLIDDARMITDCEQFFLGTRKSDIGGWFDVLSTNLNGEELVRMTKRKAHAFLRECKQHQPQSIDDYKDIKKRKACYFDCPFCGGKVKWVRRTGQINAFPHLNAIVVHRCENCGVESRSLIAKDLPKGIDCPTCRHFYMENRMKCRIHPNIKDRRVECKDWEACDMSE